MKYLFYLFILIFFSTCGYPDIDTVPKFDELTLTKEESIDLCKLSSSDNEEINKCIKSLEIEK